MTNFPNATTFCVRFTILVVAILFGYPTNAQDETWDFEGVITKSPILSGDKVGDRYSLHFAYPGIYQPPATSTDVYYSITTYDFINLECHCGFGGGLSRPGALFVGNDLPFSGGRTVDGIIFSTEHDPSFPKGRLFDGFVPGITLANPSNGTTATPLNNTDFPVSINLNQFSIRTMSIYRNYPLQIAGTVDRYFHNGVLISEVPEPSFISVFVLGSFLLVIRGRLKRILNKAI